MDKIKTMVLGLFAALCLGGCNWSFGTTDADATAALSRLAEKEQAQNAELTRENTSLAHRTGQAEGAIGLALAIGLPATIAIALIAFWMGTTWGRRNPHVVYERQPVYFREPMSYDQAFEMVMQHVPAWNAPAVRAMIGGGRQPGRDIEVRS